MIDNFSSEVGDNEEGQVTPARDSSTNPSSAGQNKYYKYQNPLSMKTTPMTKVESSANQAKSGLKAYQFGTMDQNSNQMMQEPMQEPH